MNSEKIKKPIRFKTTELCPVTGLPIYSRPEWNNVSFGKNYKITFSLIGDSILFLRISGFATLDVIKKALSFSDNIIRELIPENRKYIMIEKFSKLAGNSREARKYFINHQQ